ncbi:MAG: hypothetical protein AB1371_12080 [Pseudomonadota bacterium]
MAGEHEQGRIPWAGDKAGTPHAAMGLAVLVALLIVAIGMGVAAWLRAQAQQGLQTYLVAPEIFITA